MEGFVEITEGIWFCEEDGTPWSSKYCTGSPKQGTRQVHYDGKLKPLKSKNRGYYKITIEGKTHYWGRLVWKYFYGSITDDLVIDYKNGKRDDNRLSNLRLCKKQQNNQNTSRRSGSASKFLGVSFHKGHKKWVAQITVDCKRICLGYFENEIEAAKAYDAAALKHFGEFSNLNFK